MTIPEHIFKSYDIRGLVEGELSLELAYRVGQAVVARTGAKTLVVGRDMRPTSEGFAKQVTLGARAMGANVVDIGLCSTPLFNFAVTFFPEHEAGVMVTASHNPGAYNGFKMAMHDGVPIGKGTGMEEISEMVRGGRLEAAASVGSIETLNVEEEYLQEIFTHAAPLPDFSGLRVAVDVGNGMGGLLLSRIFEKLGCAWEGLYLNPDGAFPNHEPNPLEEHNVADLRALMKRMDAHVGVGLDGDGDRIVFLDEQGAIVRGDHVLAILAGDLLKGHPGATVWYDLRATHAAVEAVETAGGVAKMSEVGHANFKRHMREEGGVFGAELSCHFFFAEFGNAEASEYMLVRFLAHLARAGKPLSMLAEPYRKYAHSGEVNFKVADRAAALALIESTYASKAKSRIDIDGITLQFDDWWFNLRPSNTEPLVRLTLETPSPETTKAWLAELSALLQT